MTMTPPPFPKLILLLMTDQFRYDAFSPEITPNLYNELSLDQQTTTFSNAYVSSPICTPARAALLTGKSPWAHGMLGYGYTVNCSSYPSTLAEILSGDGGYQTYAVGKNHFGWNPSGDYVGHGYKNRQVHDAMTNQPYWDEYMRYWDNLHPGVDPLSVTCEHGLTYNEWRSCPYGGPKEEEHPTPWTTRKAIEYLNEFNFTTTDNTDNNNKMFLKVSYHRPHSPYDPPKRLLEKRLKGHVPKRIINNTSWDQLYLNTSEMSKSDWHGDPGEIASHHTRAGYLASCEFVDEGIGQIFNTLKQKGLWDETMILWTTDHGDMNGDHNLWRKGYPYEASSHVNLIIKLPLVAGAEGTSTTTTTSTKSISSTGDGSRVDSASMQQQQAGKEEKRQQGNNSNQIKKDNNNKPTISDAIVETRDIAVTLYDYLGILDQVKGRDPLVDGLSLLPILQGNSNKDYQVRTWLDMELSTQYRADIHWNAIVGKYNEETTTATTDAGGGPSRAGSTKTIQQKCGLWKYIFHVLIGTEQLFCLTTDRNEHHNLAVETEFRPVLEFWRNKLIKLFEKQKRGKRWIRNGRLVTGRPPITFETNYPCKYYATDEEEEEEANQESVA